MKKIGYLLMFLAVAFFNGCTEKEELNDEIAGKTYFPMNIGDYRIYNVQFKRWLQNKVVDSSEFQLRERVDTLYTDLSGQPTYKIIRSKRPTSDDIWVDDSVITISLTNNQVRRHMDNVTEVKMIFPVAENKHWDPNVYNTREPGNAYYQDVNLPYILDGKQYVKTTKVVVSNFESAINHDFREEVYADNIGLIYKKYDVIEYCNIPDCNFDPTYILRGYLRTETLDSYGHTDR